MTWTKETVTGLISITKTLNVTAVAYFLEDFFAVIAQLLHVVKLRKN